MQKKITTLHTLSRAEVLEILTDYLDIDHTLTPDFTFYDSNSDEYDFASLEVTTTETE